MMPVIILMVIGLLLLAAEIIVPGGVLGIIGGLALIAGVIVAFNTLEQSRAMMVLGIALFMGIGVLILEFAVLPRSRLVRKLSMTATVAGTSQAIGDSARALIGQEATAQTKLVPSGYILIAGKQYEAFSRDGVVEAGARLRVVDVDNFRLIVSRTQS